MDEKNSADFSKAPAPSVQASRKPENAGGNSAEFQSSNQNANFFINANDESRVIELISKDQVSFKVSRKMLSLSKSISAIFEGSRADFNSENLKIK